MFYFTFVLNINKLLVKYNLNIVWINLNVFLYYFVLFLIYDKYLSFIQISCTKIITYLLKYCCIISIYTFETLKYRLMIAIFSMFNNMIILLKFWFLEFISLLKNHIFKYLDIMYHKGVSCSNINYFIQMRIIIALFFQ